MKCVYILLDFNTTACYTYKDIELSKNGLEECPNFHSNNSTDTIWVKNCEETTKQYKSK